MPAAERKRPWYLVLALLGTLALGTTGACGGWSTIAFYREPMPASIEGQGIADEADRAAVAARAQAYVQALEGARRRAWPLGVAALLLGSALLVFSMRALSGSKSARAVLVQLAVVQAVANAASYWLMRDVFEAELRKFEAEQAAEFHQRVPERSRADDMARSASGMLRAANPIAFALRTLGSALVVVALTRRKSREFLDAGREAIEGR
jgi:hypothetical protein